MRIFIAASLLFLVHCSGGGGYFPRLTDGGTADLHGPKSDGGPSCSDNMKDGNETDVDCGGGSCPACLTGRMCSVPSDCQTNLCTGQHCAPMASCSDGIKNGSETDTDCGGPMCSQCADGRSCEVPTDCQSDNCPTGTCIPAANCNDGIQNGQETDVDCGGGTCPTCQDDQSCSNSNDCSDANCSMLLCCAFGTGNCNGSKNDGCESSLMTDPSNCGTCGLVCGINTPTCANGQCIAQAKNHTDGEGDSWSDNTPTGTYNLQEATMACQTYVNAKLGGNDTCITTACGCNANADLCVYNNTAVPRHTWFYGSGAMKGQDTLNCCGCAFTTWN